MVLEKIFLIGQSQTRTVYSGNVNFVQDKRSQRIGTKWCRRGCDCMVGGFTTAYMQIVSITTDVVNLNLDQDVQNFVIKFDNDFLRVLQP